MDNNIYAVSYKMKKELYHRIFTVSGFVILSIFLISLFMSFVIYPVFCTTDSMAPNIPPKSMEFVSPLFKNPSRGDLVLIQNYEQEKLSAGKKIINSICLFFTARMWQPYDSRPSVGTRPVIRRVVGLPGDTVYIDRYVVFIKSAGENHYLTEFEVSETKYNIEILVPPAGWDVDMGAKSSIEKMTLGPDEYYVLGDKRISASDSRVWGPVKHSKIKGMVLLQYYPFNKIKIF